MFALLTQSLELHFLTMDLLLKFVEGLGDLLRHHFVLFGDAFLKLLLRVLDERSVGLMLAEQLSQLL